VLRSYALRFSLCYWLLCLPPFPLGLVPGTESAGLSLLRVREALVQLVGRQLFGLEIPDGQYSGADTVSNYVAMLCFVVMALVIAALWTAARRRALEREDPRLSALHQVGLRYVLGTSMLGYAAVKLWKIQFPALQPSDLELSYGESSPMGLLWRFMGHSTAYVFVTGLAELLGGVLLFSRRTTLLGALVLVGVMTQVVLLNLCFDVNVKIWSAHLLSMSVILAAHQLRPLVAFFLRGVPARQEPAPVVFSAPPRWLPRAHAGAKVLLLGAFTLQLVTSTRELYTTFGDGRAPMPLEGSYAVEAAPLADAAVAPPPFQKVTIDRQGFVTFSGDGKHTGWKVAYDEAAGSFAVEEYRGMGKLASDPATRVEPDAAVLDLSGSIGEKSTRLVLRKVESRDAQLNKRGFHWVNDTPFYR
jgi:hypothetical protein